MQRGSTAYLSRVKKTTHLEIRPGGSWSLRRGGRLQVLETRTCRLFDISAFSRHSAEDLKFFFRLRDAAQLSSINITAADAACLHRRVARRNRIMCRFNKEKETQQFSYDYSWWSCVQSCTWDKTKELFLHITVISVIDFHALNHLQDFVVDYTWNSSFDGLKLLWADRKSFVAESQQRH